MGWREREREKENFHLRRASKKKTNVIQHHANHIAGLLRKIKELEEEKEHLLE